MLKHFLNLIRIKHWIKNLLLFLPAFFGGVILEKDNIVMLLCLFIYFSLTASIVYVFNDLIDLEKDKLHPQKKNRALASGKINLQGSLEVKTVKE